MTFIQVEAFVADMHAKAREAEDTFQKSAYVMTAKTVAEYAKTHGLSEDTANKQMNNLRVIKWI